MISVQNLCLCRISSVLVFCIINIFTAEVAGGKILFLLPIATKSHRNIFDPLINGLAENNHEIFVISSVNSSGIPKNVEEIIPIPLEYIFSEMINVFEAREKTDWNRNLVKTDLIINACNSVYENPRIKEILKTKQNYFDLIIINAMANHCFYGMVPILGAPVVSIVTFPPTNQLAEKYGTHLPNSFVPNPFLPFSDRMSFAERMVNTAFNWISPLLNRYFYSWRIEEVYKQHLGDHLPSNDKIESNFSVLFSNTHFSINYPRPLLPDIVEIGGIHCRPSKPLPTDLEEFVAGDSGGFIYFSLGSMIKEMPEKYRNAFINTFASLKQRVLWKWDNDHMDDLSDNIKLIRWAPQQDILGHKNIKLFISHGGLLSTQEAVYHGVPVLNIPFFADQDLNSNSNFQAGFALTVEIIGMTEELLSSNIKQILENPKFSMRAKELSTIFKDQMETPLERAVYWAEYVMKFKGAPHLRSASRDLSSFQYHSLDVISFLIVSASFMLWTTLFCVRKLSHAVSSNIMMS